MGSAAVDLAYVAAGRPASDRTFPSKIADRAHVSLNESLRELTPAQRVEAFLEHNKLVNELREAGRAAQARALSHASPRQ